MSLVIVYSRQLSGGDCPARLELGGLRCEIREAWQGLMECPLASES